VTVFLSQANAIKTLEAGVTTVRDLTGIDGADIAMRALINMGAMGGPAHVRVGSRSPEHGHPTDLMTHEFSDRGESLQNRAFCEFGMVKTRQNHLCVGRVSPEIGDNGS
jgi:hypothetical protein